MSGNHPALAALDDRVSVSSKGTSSSVASRRPTVDLPAPGGPMRMATGVTTSASPLEWRRDRPPEIGGFPGDRVTAEFLQARQPAPARPSPRRRHRRGHRADIGALVASLLPHQGQRCRRCRKRARHGRDRLHGRADAQQPATSTYRLPCRRRGRCGGGSRPRRRAPSKHAPATRGGGSSRSRPRPPTPLDCLDRHQRGAEARIKPAVPVHVRAEAGAGTSYATTSTIPPSVSPILLRRLDFGDHRGGAGRVQRAHRPASSASTSSGVGSAASGPTESSR